MTEKKFCILSVAPIVASKLPDKFLSYVSDTDFPAGSLVQVPLRNKRVFGIVFSSQPAHDLKLHLKKERFNLKPIGLIGSTRLNDEVGQVGPICSAEFLSFLKAAADYFITHPGAILRSIVPVRSLSAGAEIQSIFEKKLKEYSEKNARGELDHTKQLRYPYIDIKTLLTLAQKKLGIGFLGPIGPMGPIGPIKLVSWPSNGQLQLSHGRTLIFINRKGMTPVLYCQDCGKAQLCENCDAPLVLHKNSGGLASRIFLCHHCGKSTKIQDACKYCSSWRLKPWGIGIQQIEKHIGPTRLNDEVGQVGPIFRIDSTTAPTPKKAREIYERFLSESAGRRNAVLLGTSAIFSLRPEKFDTVFFLFPEQILNLPEFSGPERLLHTVQKLASLSKNGLRLYTKIPEHPLLRYFSNWSCPPAMPAQAWRAGKSYRSYIEEDLRLRKKFGYPPFKKLIKITLLHRDEKKLLVEKNHFEKQLARIQKSTPGVDSGSRLRELTFSSYPAFIKRVKSLYRWYILLKLDPKENYPQLYEFLYSLPPSIKVEVDPISLL